jgi:hypothetical protein
VGAQKKPSSGLRAAKPTRRRSAETAKNPKKHKNRQKSNTTKHQNKYQSKYRKTKAKTEKPKQKQGNPKNKGSTGGKLKRDLARNTAAGGGDGCLTWWESVTDLQQAKDIELPDIGRPKQGNPKTNGKTRKKPEETTDHNSA